MIIKTHKIHLMQRCQERGYTLSEVAGCIKFKDGDIWEIDTDHPSYPSPGLGDKVAAGLAMVGITKERFSRILGKKCGCEKRQSALNRLGRRLGVK